ncbi:MULTISPECIES: GntR family transcriptional regulator [unclassified Cupriavidus]|uniref:GntR family transcriptional regulator n=1 Tax=unclassified Cupriavidus TaxID=2640874 RepID=UPI001C008DC2|nr:MULTISPECIES: GntR family transcriptional regulator [unclassified Cupriavidus]MCA3192379.1 GntR family transcriptional regulator [Cupriavidus sp.]MCA3196154.1 GntR family transcriptional regulator [Cupriavidus sp.]MCA3203687.1 GntR family transcriptional regulator [Cupriavidus sp.]MCA3210293.1 GntR family transcriptional regulator [Cupriavidus sp.]MCA3232427.1 GntR family transcriptional regulator [Cupriavidus sp.]
MSTSPTLSSQAVDRQILHVAVAQRLRTMIMEGDLAPGTRLNERVLCDLLQVSRTPLREAFKVLAADGLVTLLPNRGAEVVVLSTDMVNHLFEMMGALEAMSGELACQRITEAELNEIRALHFEMLACHARRDLPNYYALNRRIHDAINAAARNPILEETYRRINLRIQALRFRSNFDHDKWDMAVREHGAMLDALAKRDGAALRDILRAHLEHKHDALIAELERAQNVAA